MESESTVEFALNQNYILLLNECSLTVYGNVYGIVYGIVYGNLWKWKKNEIVYRLFYGNLKL